MPLYLYEELHYNIKQASGISAIPSFVKPVLTLIAAFVADFLMNRCGVSKAVMRKSMTTLGLFLPGVAMAMAGHIGCHKVALIVLFTVSVGFDGFTTPGFKSNHIEIAPAYSGILFGVTNTFGNMPGFIGPTIAGSILSTHSGIDGWHIVFWIGGEGLHHI